MTRATIGPTQSRTWKADPLLEDRETLEPEDYTDAHAELHTDRGHQVPLASFTGTEHWRDTNYLSNITPQKSALNRGAWATLEGKVRDLAQQPGVEVVYVMTGPLYERPMPALPRADEAHMVPSAYWKIVAVREGIGARVAAFYFDQSTPSGSDYCDHLTTVDDLEARSGLDFFHGLATPLQEALEQEPSELVTELGCPAT